MPHGYGVFPVAHIFTVLLGLLALPDLLALTVLPGLPALTALSVLPDPLGRLFTHNIRNLFGDEYVSR